jgi:hypothetical protein
MDLSFAPKRYVFFEDGRVEVRANSVSELRIAVKELRLVKREYRLKKKALASRLRSLKPLARTLISHGDLLPMENAEGSAVLTAEQIAEGLESGSAALGYLDQAIHLIEEIEIKVETAILRDTP